MSTSVRVSARARRSHAVSLTGSLAFKTTALMATAALSFLLWAAAIPQLYGAVTKYGAAATAAATVVRCPDGQALTGQCDVLFQTDRGHVVRRLAHTGLIAVEVGDQVPVWVDEAGAPSVGGWRPYLDALALCLLATGLTAFALRWWRRVLFHGGAPDAARPR